MVSEYIYLACELPAYGATFRLDGKASAESVRGALGGLIDSNEPVLYLTRR